MKDLTASSLFFLLGALFFSAIFFEVGSRHGKSSAADQHALDIYLLESAEDRLELCQQHLMHEEISNFIDL